jgi:hypothetical protein
VSMNVGGETALERALRGLQRNRFGAGALFAIAAIAGDMQGNPFTSKWYFHTKRPSSQSGRLRA